jgi:1-deoxy-D-xylulose-5-phosphate synthase
LVAKSLLCIKKQETNLDYQVLSRLSDKIFFNQLSVKELEEYAELIRQFLIEVCSHKSTHLASNLGTVEIFLALHRVFDFDRDLITFDVGHQVYTYKILTGRFNSFDTIRQFGGLSGFPDPAESKADLFKVGHVGCGLPLALGLSIAKSADKKKEDSDSPANDPQIITLVGDGTLTNGAMLEALNFIANRKNGKIIIILNDNGMSIAKTAPSMSKKLSLYATSLNIRGSLEKKLKNKNHSAFIESLIKIIQDIKNLILPKQFFEDFGIRYVGPIDGHNIQELIEYFTFAKNFKNTLLIHVKTVKGKGYPPAEANPELFHSAPPFDISTGNITTATTETFTSYFGKLIVSKAREDDQIFAITAAMKNGTGLDEFALNFADRFIDVGIAESLAVSIGAGLAKMGKLPVVAIYSIFLQRAAAQVYHDVVLNKLPVFFAIDRTGLVGIDGPTHHGLYINPFLSSLPDIFILACFCKEDMDYGFSLLGKVDKPVFLLYPKESIYSFSEICKKILKVDSSRTTGYDGTKVDIKLNADCKAINNDTTSLNKLNYREGKVTELISGDKCAIVAIGSGLTISIDALEILAEEQFYPGLYYISQIKPFDFEDIVFEQIFEKYEQIIIVDEEPTLSLIVNYFHRYSLEKNYNGKIIPFTLPDMIIPHGTRKQLFDHIKFNGKQLGQLVKKSINHEPLNRY